MSVTLAGRAGQRLVERRWTIIAERGEGIEIPTLAAEILAAEILAGRLGPGARPAAALLPFERYKAALARLAVRHATSERTLPPPLYARLLGPDWAALPPAVRAMHDLNRDAGAAGEGLVTRGAGRLARLIARVMRFPPSGTWPLNVAFAERRGAETWTRDFGGHAFSSELSMSGDLLIERFGPLRFGFELPAGPRGLEMRLRRWTAFRIPLPLVFAPRIAAREWEEEGRFRFEVRVALPLAGDVIAYRGWLERTDVGACDCAAEVAAA